MLTIPATLTTQRIVLTSNTSWYLYNFRKGTIRALLSRGYDVVCVAPQDAYSEKLEALGATFNPIRLDGKSTSIHKELMTFTSAFALIKKLQPHYVFNFTIKMNLYMGLICRMLSIPYANNISGLGTVFLHDALVYRLARKLYGIANKGARKVFFQNSDDLSLFISEKLVENTSTETLPGSGVDTDYFCWKPLPADKPIVFLMVARLIKDKGVREYVEAAKIVREKHREARFLLVGPCGISNKTAISKEEIDEWCSDGIIEYHGEQEDIRPWIERCHVLVLPSYREGMPRVVLEAASVGRPAIVTDVPGCRQSIVEGKTGWYCTARDSTSLATAMESVLLISHSEIENMGRLARARICESFSEETVISSYLNCLIRLSNKAIAAFYSGK